MPKAKLWTEEEKEFLKNNIHLKYKQISEQLDRSDSSVRKKIKELGLQGAYDKHHNTKGIWKWTEEQITYLKDNYATATFDEMSLYLGKGESTIRWKGNQLGLKRKQREVRRWTSEDVEFLKNHYSNIELEKIAKKLNRSKSSIIQKASLLNLLIEAEGEIFRGVRYKCSYIDRGVSKTRKSIYPTETCVEKASARVIDNLTNMMGYTDVKVLEVEKL